LLFIFIARFRPINQHRQHGLEAEVSHPFSILVVCSYQPNGIFWSQL